MILEQIQKTAPEIFAEMRNEKQVEIPTQVQDNNGSKKRTFSSWSKEEDQQLDELVSKYGKNWDEIIRNSTLKKSRKQIQGRYYYKKRKLGDNLIVQQ